MSDQATLPALVKLFARDLNRLKEEISLYPTEALLWRTAEGISNTGGTLALHLCGNLQHFVGAVLGASGYIRQRELEFSAQVTRRELLDQVNATITTVSQTLQQLPASELVAPYPPGYYREEMQTGAFLLHLYAHLSYHLGQINYHRRILS